jgi:radical SAM family uncharacterized protein/radical SAM-linked protein
MATDVIQDLLPLVEQPSRYLGTEINASRKDSKLAQVSVALAFPDLYEIGSSHFGIQILYHILNQQEDIRAERVFAPGMDMEKLLVDSGLPLGSLESGTPLGDFDIVGMSLLYELTYTNMLAMLKLAHIPFLAAERGAEDPLLIAGGPCTCNPEPVAAFFDAILVGDGEKAILEMVAGYQREKESGAVNKERLFRRWSTIRGVYIPTLFHETVDDRGGIRVFSEKGLTVRREVLPSLDELPYPDKPLVPFGKPVHDRLRVEVARGCTRGCRFCQAGMIYRPVREKSPDTILRQVEETLPATGYDDISLLSLSTGDYGCIAPLMDRLMNRCEAERIAVSLPSLRAGSISPELMEQIRKVRKTGFTIAPEAGTQRLRDVINKNVSRKDIFDTAQQAFSLGWRVIKLYFMIGLPTETDEDIDGIVELVKELHQHCRRIAGSRAKINVSISTFVPKPHTPFQWEPQISLEESKRKLDYLRSALRRPGIQMKWQNPEVSYIEGIWSRGDRRLSGLLVTAFEEGCRFDGWSDHFDFVRWQRALEKEGFGDDVTRRRTVFETLPWDHVDNGVSREFLVEEREKALAGRLTGDCRMDACQQCGVCDFTSLAPVTFDQADFCRNAQTDREKGPSGEESHRYRIYYSKTGPARFLGHIELAKTFSRAARRATLPLSFSRGFHPMPKISFTDPLPIGMESEREETVFVLARKMDSVQLSRRLARQLPEGLTVVDCHAVTSENPPSPLTRPGGVTYEVELAEGRFRKTDLESYANARSVVVTKKGKKGKIRTIELKERVALRYLSPRRLRLTIGSSTGSQLRPRHILEAVFHLTERQVLTARTLKLAGGHQE